MNRYSARSRPNWEEPVRRTAANRRCFSRQFARFHPPPPPPPPHPILHKGFRTINYSNVKSPLPFVPLPSPCGTTMVEIVRRNCIGFVPKPIFTCQRNGGISVDFGSISSLGSIRNIRDERAKRGGEDDFGSVLMRSRRFES